MTHKSLKRSYPSLHCYSLDILRSSMTMGCIVEWVLYVCIATVCCKQEKLTYIKNILDKLLWTKLYPCSFKLTFGGCWKGCESFLIKCLLTHIPLCSLRQLSVAQLSPWFPSNARMSLHFQAIMSCTIFILCICVCYCSLACTYGGLLEAWVDKPVGPVHQGYERSAFLPLSQLLCEYTVLDGLDSFNQVVLSVDENITMEVGHYDLMEPQEGE